MRKPNYDKFPSTKVEGVIVEGWKNILDLLGKELQEKRCIAVDLYPGVIEEEIISNLQKIEADSFYDMRRDVFKSEQEVLKMTERFMTDDVLFGFMAKGGYELRNKIFKGCTSKAITSIINKDSRTLCIFEGWADYLSYLEMTTANKNKVIRDHNKGFNESYLILNSLSMKSQIMNHITEFEDVKLFLDQDNEAKRLASDLKASFSNIKDYSDTYSKFKDLNDYHIDQMRVHQETKNTINKLKI